MKRNFNINALFICISSLLVSSVTSTPAWALVTPSGAQNPVEPSSHARVSVPKVQVIRQDGIKVLFHKALSDKKPTVVAFVFGTCKSTCPMQHHLFSSIQERIRKTGKEAHLVMVSIDPEHDRPDVLQESARKWKAGPQWDFFTGTVADSISIQKAFGAYRGDKMNHPAEIFVRDASHSGWVTMASLSSPDEVIERMGL